jgi:thiosulfate reductase cytochrome b subunit
MQRVLIYKKFERIWHWAQASLVILLAISGFDMHYNWGLFGFEQAFLWHQYFAWTFIGLTVFAIFWHFTTGEWRQYLPTGTKLGAMVRFYAVGIFKHEPHPVRKTRYAKLNPLQRLAYLGLKLLIFPVSITTGLLYLYFNDLDALGIEGVPLERIALTHTFAAYVLIAFMFGHIYLTTTGDSPLSNVKAMITGYEDLDEDATGGEAATA